MYIYSVYIIINALKVHKNRAMIKLTICSVYLCYMHSGRRRWLNIVACIRVVMAVRSPLRAAPAIYMCTPYNVVARRTHRDV